MGGELVSVIGSGPGALAVAADLARAGHRVALLNRRLETLASIAAARTIRVREGRRDWTAAIPVVSDQVTRHAAESGVVVLVVPAAGHDLYARMLAPALGQGQVLLLMPGGTGGAVRAARAFSVAGAASVCVAEADTLPYVARMYGPGHVRIFARLKRLLCAPFADARWPRAVDHLREFFPALHPARGVLQTSLMNFNPVLHPAVMLLNAGRVEAGPPFRFYRDGFTPFVGRVVEALDRERMAILRAYDLPEISFAEYFFWAGYGPPPEPTASIPEIMRRSAANAHIRAPGEMAHRFLAEDVPYGLVPMVALGEAAGVPCDLMRAIVSLAVAGEEDVMQERTRTLAAMGLEGRTRREIMAITHEGWPAGDTEGHRGMEEDA